MILEEKFEKGITGNTYQRVDEKHDVNIYVGYNESGKMSIVITEYGKEEVIKSSKFIKVNLKKRDDGKLALSFDLEDSAFKQLFLMFCEDIIVNCRKVGSVQAIESTIIRWKYWREMFSNQRKDILGKKEVKGLIAELIVLKNIFFETQTEADAIESWMGPLFGHKDFEIDDTWYEVKGVNENAIQVTVSSLEQLESEQDGHLVIVRLEETSSVTNGRIRLNQLVTSIIKTINDPINLSLFMGKLDNVGYMYNVEYENYNYLYKGLEKYCVKGEFPRLRRKDLNIAIGNLKYTILLDGIVKYKEV